MHHTIDRVKSKPEDYRICQCCSAINWYKNVSCIVCEYDNLRHVSDKEFDNLLNEMLNEYKGTDFEIYV